MYIYMASNLMRPSCYEPRKAESEVGDCEISQSEATKAEAC